MNNQTENGPLSSVDAVSTLKNLSTIRERCLEIYQHAKVGGLLHFHYNEDRLDEVVDYVMQVIKTRYPEGGIPYHSRIRHLEAGGVDRVADLRSKICDKNEFSRSLFELSIVSVLLDAGAGSAWSYVAKDSSGTYTRSEGLAVASYDMFCMGYFSSDCEKSLSVDSQKLQKLKVEDLQQGFQVSEGNPIVGINGRLQLLHRLGKVLEAKGSQQPSEKGVRLGVLFDSLLQEVDQKANSISAESIFDMILNNLTEIWPKGFQLSGSNIGDVGQHSLIQAKDASSGLIPFHKLSQWLTYSLLEPLELVGIKVVDLDLLTGLAEYRNGGLFVDFGVLQLKNSFGSEFMHDQQGELVVEWRAMTVVLLDKVAGLVRKRLGLDEESFPLAKVLEGGTWAAGRTIALEKRGNLDPPIQLKSDGTIF